MPARVVSPGLPVRFHGLSQEPNLRKAAGEGINAGGLAVKSQKIEDNPGRQWGLPLEHDVTAVAVRRME
ncbi:hypothetical protein ACW0JT_01360 [Arthrobacter sp. SA17]